MGKTAQIRVDIKPDGAKAGIKAIGDETSRTASGMKSALSGALSEGMKGGTDAVKGLLSTVKSAAGMIGGLLGGLGLAEMVKGSLEATAKWGALSAGIRFAGGSARDATGVMKQLQQTAIETAHDSMQLVDVFEGIRGETGSIDYATDSIEDVATAARGAHKPLEQMGAIAGTLNEKFGIAAGGDLQDTLADVVGLSEKGGVSFEDMAEKLGLIGAYAKEAGLSGREGFGSIVGLLNVADNSTGSFKKGLTAVGGLLEQLGSGAGKSKIGAALGISGGALKGDAISQIEAIMKATKGQKANLEKAFGGEQLKLLVDMGKTYSAAFDETKGNVKTKSEAATAALRSALGDASKSAVTWADITTEAASEMQKSPQKIASATEKLRQAFQSEKFQESLGKIIDKLPALAELIAKIVGFAVDNPAAAGAAVIGGTFAKGALESIITGAFKSGASAAAPTLASAIAGGAPGLASSLAPLMGPIGLALGASIAIMLVASMHQAKLDQEKRDAEAKDAQNMLTGNKGPLGGAHKIAGALEGAGAGEIDPQGAISDATAGQATAGEAQRDKVMQERLAGKSKQAAADLLLGNKLAGKYGFGNTESPMGAAGTSADPFAYGFSGAKSTPGAAAAPGAASAPAGGGGGGGAATPAWDPQLLAAMMGKSVAGQELKVRVTNPNDIGGSGGAPSGSGMLPPGWQPKR